MGAEAECTVRFNGRVSSGKALLETEALIFRGAFRLAIPYARMTGVTAESGPVARRVFSDTHAADRFVILLAERKRRS